MSKAFRDELQAKLQPMFEQGAGTSPEVLTSMESDIELLLNAGVDSFDDLLTIVQDTTMDVEKRTVACWILGAFGEKRAARALSIALDDDDLGVRWEAAKSLSMLGNKRYLRKVITVALKSKDIESRKAAVYALGWYGDERAIEPLVNILTENSEDPELRGNAAEALANMGATSAVVPLMAALRDASIEVRFWAAFALGEVGDLQTVPELKGLASEDTSVLDGWWSVKKECLDSIRRIRRRCRSASHSDD